MALGRIRISLIVFAAATLSGCATSPGHYGRFVFSGKVTAPSGAPVPGARVRIRGLESVTDPDGQWSQAQNIHCAGWDKGADAFETASVLEVSAEGYQTSVEKLAGRHAEWSSGCGSSKAVQFTTVLKPQKGGVK